MNETDEQVINLLMEQLQINREDITEDLTFGDIPQWDSLGHMMIMAALEEKFGEEINTEAIAELVNFKSIREYIEKHANA